jgi:hypothetical protein
MNAEDSQINKFSYLPSLLTENNGMSPGINHDDDGGDS